jgi:hypothetical protein
VSCLHFCLYINLYFLLGAKEFTSLDHAEQLKCLLQFDAACNHQLLDNPELEKISISTCMYIFASCFHMSNILSADFSYLAKIEAWKASLVKVHLNAIVIQLARHSKAKDVEKWSAEHATQVAWWKNLLITEEANWVDLCPRNDSHFDSKEKTLKWIHYLVDWSDQVSTCVRFG